MNAPANMDSKLWDYIDGISPDSEKPAIEELIQTDSRWRSRYFNLLQIRELLQAQEPEVPSMRFTKKVMEEIARYNILKATNKYLNNKIIFGIAAFFLVLITGMLIYFFATANWGGGSNVHIPEFSNWNLSKYINTSVLQVVMFLNVILGLFLLDRYLGRRKRQLRSQKS